MAREYFCAYYSYLSSLDVLNDAEVGRLFRALLIYSESGAVPELRGNERFIFPMMKDQIDRDAEKYQAFCVKQSEVGKKGGRPKKEENPTLFEESQKTQPFFEKPKKAKEKEKEKENIKERTTNVVPKKIFSKPSVSEVEQYCRERGNGIDAETFVDYYEARGWLFNGKQQMKDWKAAVRTWERNRQDTGPKEVNRYADLI
jgi:hypothetical protein